MQMNGIKTILNGVKVWAGGEFGKLQRLVNAARSTADNAQATADTAKSAAAAAQTTADEAKAAAVQPDWNQNDETAPDYVKNRTHYCKGEEAYALFDDVVTVTSSYYSSTQFYYFIGAFESDVVAGNVYKVTFLDETHDVTASNQGLAWTTQGGANIHINKNRDGYYIYSSENDGLTRPFDTELKIEETKEALSTLDERYIPDSIARVNKTMSSVDPVGTGSFSMGRSSGTTVGECSHAEGYMVTASGQYSHAEGEDNKASGTAAHAEGRRVTASGYSSHAEGAYTTASGYSSHAEGDNTTASGYSSHAEGVYTTAASAYQHAQGKYSIADASGKYAHIVGNGTYSVRSNAHTLDWNGVAWFQGRPQFGGTAQDDGAQSVVANGDTEIILASSTSGSAKQFKITVDDDGALSAEEVT